VKNRKDWIELILRPTRTHEVRTHEVRVFFFLILVGRPFSTPLPSSRSKNGRPISKPWVFASGMVKTIPLAEFTFQIYNKSSKSRSASRTKQFWKLKQATLGPQKIMQIVGRESTNDGALGSWSLLSYCSLTQKITMNRFSSDSAVANFHQEPGTSLSHSKEIWDENKWEIFRNPVLPSVAMLVLNEVRTTVAG